jgi:hypothetical protein
MYNTGTDSDNCPPPNSVLALEVPMELTQAYIKTILHYDPETGIFIWKVPQARRPVGREAGFSTTNGYRSIGIDAKKYLAHRIAVIYMNGEIDAAQIDHINGVRSDNRWANLRLATSADNQRNTKLRNTNTSGVMGVSWHARGGKWTARISHNSQEKYLGLFDDFFDAVCARKSAENALGYHPNHGKTFSQGAA